MVALTHNETQQLKALKSLDDLPELEWFSSGITALDMILGGGYPKGRIIEVFGPTSCGKTTLALHAAAQVQKEEGTVLYIDKENTLNKTYAAAIGVDTRTMMTARPYGAEETLDLVRLAVRSKYALVIIDSIAAMPTQAEMEASMTEEASGYRHEHILSEGLKRIVQEMGDSPQTTLLIINQLREDRTVVYGSPEKPTGGKALGYYASVRLDMRWISTIVSKRVEAGIRVKFKVRKSNVNDPFLTCESDLLFGEGFSYVHDLFDLAEELYVLHRRGSQYYFGQEKIALGREATLDALKSNSELFRAVEKEVSQWLKVHNLLDLAEKLGVLKRQDLGYCLGETFIAREREGTLNLLRSDSKLFKKVDKAIEKCQNSKK